MFQTKVVQKLETHVISNNIFFKIVGYEIMWKNIVEQGRPQMTTWCIRTACSIPKATDTHTDCVILIAFPLQQRLNKCAPMLHYTYTACLVTHGLFHCGTHSEHGTNGTTQPTGSNS